MAEEKARGPMVQLQAIWVFTEGSYLMEEKRLRDFMEELVQTLDMTVILPTIGVRLPIKEYKDIRGRVPSDVDYGYTLVTLISESHVTVHTWPKFKKAFMEIASCKEFDGAPVLTIIEKFFPECSITSRGFVL